MRGCRFKSVSDAELPLVTESFFFFSFQEPAEAERQQLPLQRSYWQHARHPPPHLCLVLPPHPSMPQHAPEWPECHFIFILLLFLFMYTSQPITNPDVQQRVVTFFTRTTHLFEKIQTEELYLNLKDRQLCVKLFPDWTLLSYFVHI